MIQPVIKMRQAAVLLTLLLLLTSTVASQNKQRRWERGTWEGTGYQTDDNTTWAMKLTVRKLKGGRRTFSIDYPSLNCGGRWQPLSLNQNKARFREVLDHGQDTCSDKGTVTIERIGRQLVFLYANEGSREITASAVLSRKTAANLRQQAKSSN